MSHLHYVRLYSQQKWSQLEDKNTVGPIGDTVNGSGLGVGMYSLSRMVKPKMVNVECTANSDVSAAVEVETWELD